MYFIYLNMRNLLFTVNRFLTCLDNVLATSFAVTESASTSWRNVSHVWNIVDGHVGLTNILGNIMSQNKTMKCTVFSCGVFITLCYAKYTLRHPIKFRTNYLSFRSSLLRFRNDETSIWSDSPCCSYNCDSCCVKSDTKI